MKRWQTELLRLRRLNFVLIVSMMALSVIGVMFVYSAGYVEDIPSGSTASKYKRQILWVVVGGIAFFAAALFDYRQFRKLSPWIYMAGIFLLLLVAVTGTVEFGARRWLRVLPGLKVQPSELVKLSVLIMLARYMSQPALNLRSWRCVGAVLVIVGVPFLLITMQPDLGTAMIFLPFAFVMMFVAGIPLRYLVALVLVGLLILPLAWVTLDDYQQERILVFLDPSRDPFGAGWSKHQSELAIGSGGMWGKGFLRGTQNTLGFLPRSVAPTDFIYSVIAEESGFVGSVAVLALFAVVLACGLRTALVTRDKMGRLLAVGVVTIVFGHVFVNIAMTVGLMPITGLPLPLISYGGSFTISTMVGLGILQSVHIRRPRSTQ